MAESMAIFSLVVNIIDLVEVTAKIVKQAQSFQEASDGIQTCLGTIAICLPIVQLTVEQTRKRVENKSFDKLTRGAIEPALNGIHKSLAELKDYIKDFTPKDGASKVKIFWKATTLVFKERRIQDATKQLHDHINALTYYHSAHADAQSLSPDDHRQIKTALMEVQNSQAKNVHKLETQHLSLLSIDGGGLKGLSAIYILMHLMEKVNEGQDPQLKPCDVFDLIGGTGTGGLIAVMLGRLGMTADECLDEYLTLFERLAKSTNDTEDSTPIKIDSAVLKKVITELVCRRGYKTDSLLHDESIRCKSFVCATAGNTTAVQFQTYTVRGVFNPDNKVTMVDAICATLSAANVFTAVKFGRPLRDYISGDVGANNPIQVLWNKGIELFGNRAEVLDSKLRCLISIGAGELPPANIRDDYARAVEDIARGTDEKYESFAKSHPILSDEERLVRFNVSGLGNTGWKEWEKAGDIGLTTNDYMWRQEHKYKIKSCSGKLLEVAQINIPNKSTATALLQSFKQVLQLSYKSNMHLKWTEMFPEISTYDHEMVLRQCLEARVDGTGEWLEENEQYIKWCDEENDKTKSMWCSGGIGSGKTSIAATAIGKIRDTNSIRPSRLRPVLHYFVEHKIGQVTSTEEIFGSFINQHLAHLDTSNLKPFQEGSISTRLHEKIEHVRDRGEKHHKIMTVSSVLSFTDLQEILVELNSMCEHSVYVVDGFSLLSANDQTRMLEVMEGILIPKQKSSLMLTSVRDLPAKSKKKCHELILKREFIENDLRTFILAEWQRLDGSIESGWEDWALKMKDEIVEAILAETGTMFLWAKFQLQDVFECASQGLAKHKLKECLPKSLPHIFIDRLKAMNKNDILRTYTATEQPPTVGENNNQPQRAELWDSQAGPMLFRWVGCATRLLSTSELGEALAFNPLRDDVWQKERIIDRGKILNYVQQCGGLLVVEKNEQNGTEVVRFSHSSVERFFSQSSYEIASDLSSWRPNSSDGPLKCGEYILAYLCLEDYENALFKGAEDPLSPIPTPKHIIEQIIEIEMLKFFALWCLSIWIFFKSPTKLQSEAVAAYHLTLQYLKSLGEFSAAISKDKKLHNYAYAERNWIHHTKSLTEDSWAWEKFEKLILRPESIGLPHHWQLLGKSDQWYFHRLFLHAIKLDHVPLARVLLKESAATRTDIINKPLDGNLPALHLACRSGSCKIVSMLLVEKSCKKDLLDKSKNRQSALYYGIRFGHLDIVNKLLHDPSFKICSLKVNPIALAVESGSVKILEKILEELHKDRSISQHLEQENDWGLTPLGQAARLGHWKAIRMLLKFEAKRNTEMTPKYPHETKREEGKKWTALHLAAAANQELAVKELLGPGLRSKDKKNRALPKNSYSATALSIAAYHGYTNIVDLFIKADVDLAQPASPDAYEFWYELRDEGSALFWAAFKGHTEVAKRLQKAEKSLSTTLSSKKLTPAVGAVENGHYSTMQELIYYLRDEYYRDTVEIRSKKISRLDMIVDSEWGSFFLDTPTALITSALSKEEKTEPGVKIFFTNHYVKVFQEYESPKELTFILDIEHHNGQDLEFTIDAGRDSSTGRGAAFTRITIPDGKCFQTDPEKGEKSPQRVVCRWSCS